MAKLAIKGGNPVRTEPYMVWPPVHDEEVLAVNRVLHEGQMGRITRFGNDGSNETDQLREAWKEQYPGKEFALPCGSCCAALELALRNAGIGPGDEVITPPSTWVASNLAPFRAGADVAFADVSPDNYCLDPQAVREAITPRTRGILLVHVGGYCARMDEIMSLAEEHDLVVIEDCAQAQGSKYKDRFVGTWGHFGCFSFDAGKLMPAGEGGMLVFDAADLPGDWIHGICGHAGAQIDALKAGRRIDGWNYRMTEIQAAILLAKLARTEKEKWTRMANADHLRRRLAEIEGIGEVAYEPEQAYYSFIFKYDSTAFKGVPKQMFKQALAAEGINKLFSSPSDQEPAYRSAYFNPNGRDYSQVVCPVAERAYRHEAVGISGTEVLLGTRSEMDQIVDAIVKIQENADELKGGVRDGVAEGTGAE